MPLEIVFKIFSGYDVSPRVVTIKHKRFVQCLVKWYQRAMYLYDRMCHFLLRHLIVSLNSHVAHIKLLIRKLQRIVKVGSKDILPFSI